MEHTHSRLLHFSRLQLRGGRESTCDSSWLQGTVEAQRLASLSSRCSDIPSFLSTQTPEGRESLQCDSYHTSMHRNFSVEEQAYDCCYGAATANRSCTAAILFRPLLLHHALAPVHALSFLELDGSTFSALTHYYCRSLLMCASLSHVRGSQDLFSDSPVDLWTSPSSL